MFKLGIRAIEAISPRKIIINEGIIDSATLSSPAYWNIRTERVSKSNGLNIKVKGNSFIVSTKTRINPTSIGPLRSGMCILKRTSGQLLPRLVAALSMLVEILSNPASSPPFETAKNRMLYPQTSKLKMFICQILALNEIRARAKTEPGIAYPMLDRKVNILIHLWFCHLLAIDKINDRNIVIRETAKAKLKLLIVRPIRSVLNP